jgi:hypothetical protein
LKGKTMSDEVEVYKSAEIEAEIQAQVDKVRQAVANGKDVSCNYDNGCAMFIIEVGSDGYEQQREICGNDLVYALAYALGVEDVFGA